MMARARGPERRPDRRQALINSIDIRLERLPAQEAALRSALEPYGRGFSAARWNADFESFDADAINRVHPVTGGFESIVNNVTEAAVAAGKLVGLEPAKQQRSGVQGYLETLHREGCFTGRQKTVVDEAYTMTSLLRHASPTVDGAELRGQIRRLLRDLREIVGAFVDWLAGHGVDLTKR
jgi:hypothetical protein